MTSKNSASADILIEQDGHIYIYRPVSVIAKAWANEFHGSMLNSYFFHSSRMPEFEKAINQNRLNLVWE